MKLISSPDKLQRYILDKKSKGLTISFVPTMGALHDGHMSLIKRAKREGDIVVVSIFVNPKQFGPNEDFKKYPETIEKDKKLLKEYGVDILFCPKLENMYPKCYSTYVVEEDLSRAMCGKDRPGHFKGVTTIVLKLFNIVQPDIVLFGQKDYQQSMVIKRMIRDLNIPVRIIVMPVIRDRNGLALSSRNRYLSDKEYKKALLLPEMLKKRRIIADKDVRIDYFVIADKNTLKPLKKPIKNKTLIAVAAKIGRTRLIDNILV